MLRPFIHVMSVDSSVLLFIPWRAMVFHRVNVLQCTCQFSY